VSTENIAITTPNIRCYLNITFTMHSVPGLVLAALLLALPMAKAQGGGGGGSSSPTYYTKVVMAHAVLGILAWVIFFPLGAVLVRLIKSPAAARIHGYVQVFALVLFIAGAGMGIWMAKTTQQLDAYHPIIGLVLLSVVCIQAISGYVQHLLYKKGRRTALMNFTHVWLGRALITLGMINGGLGLLLSSNGSRADYIAYGVIAAVIWLCYIMVVTFVQIRKRPEQLASKEDSPAMSEYGP